MITPNPFENAKAIHFVGIKGVAMTSLALWAKEAGYIVTGSDVSDEFPTDALLKNAGITVQIGFSPVHVSGDVVVYTGAHGGRDNAEVKEAIHRGIPVYPHGKALGMVMDAKRQISVAGCHGKTTTSAMIATILSDAGIDPSYAVGCGDVRGLGNPAHAGKGAFFVAEADEYVTDPHHDNTPRFLWQHPEILVITNIDYDHPDVYPDFSSIQQAYLALTQNMRGKKLCITNADDTNSDGIRNESHISHLTFGYGSNAQTVIKRQKISPDGNSFLLSQNGKERGPFTVHVPGSQNVMNAAAAVLVCEQVGLDDTVIAAGLAKYSGAKRRFELVGKKNGATVIDDYAHHPTEIIATVTAAREWYPNSRLITVFQPHTYSRTKQLFSEFANAFTLSDMVILAPIYASARETPDTEISSQRLAGAIKKYKKNVSCVASYDELVPLLLQTLQAGDILLFLGAGDIGLWGKRFFDS